VHLALIILPGIVLKVPITRSQFLFKAKKVRYTVDAHALAERYTTRVSGLGLLDRFPPDRQLETRWVPVLFWVLAHHIAGQHGVGVWRMRLQEPKSVLIRQDILP
jgi:hypothetical protein